MILVGSADVAATRRKSTRPSGLVAKGETSNNWRSLFIGVSRHDIAKDAWPAPGELQPCAFLIEQPPNAALRTHFHVPNQFQVVAGGSGTLGRHPIKYGSVHFTGPYTAYGPIADAGEGVAYMTLRNAFDPGAQFMPEARDSLRASRTGGHREREADPGPHLSPEELAAVREGLSMAMWAQEEDGMGAWFHRIPAGKSVTGTDPSVGGGQYWMVMGGTMVHQGEELPRLSCVFVTPDEAAFTATAGAGGLEVLSLQYPVLPKH